MKTKRLFIGAHIDSELFEYALDDLKEDFDGALFGKWVEAHNLHFTFKFLGDTDAQLIPKICDVLDEELQRKHIEIEFAGLGAFPNLRDPRVLFVKMNYANRALEKIRDSIENKLYSLGIPKESKAFKPHLTLLRVKSCNPESFQSVLQNYQDFSFGVQSAFKISLIESKLTPSEPIYTNLK
jgi:2'-5' RNA ligase